MNPRYSAPLGAGAHTILNGEVTQMIKINGRIMPTATLTGYDEKRQRYSGMPGRNFSSNGADFHRFTEGVVKGDKIIVSDVVYRRMVFGKTSWFGG